MILLFDVGNTHIVMGLVENNKITSTYRFITDGNVTEDEYYNKFQTILKDKSVEGIAISSVVPQVNQSLSLMCEKYYNISPLIIGPGVKSGIKIKLENPKQLGSDLLCDAVGAVAKYDGASIIVDLGTATKFIVVNSQKEFLGGAISPGLVGSLNNLVNSAAKLSNVSLHTPETVVGNETTHCIQSGVVFGFASLVDGMVSKIKDELQDEKVSVILTGGLSKILLSCIKTPYFYQPNLLLEGLLIIYQKNK